VEASKVRRRIGAVIVSLSAAAATVLAARQPITWGPNAAVLRINSSRCAGSTTDRVGTGFLWGGARQAVTSLHVVAGCTSFLVHSQHDNLDYRAAVLRVYRKADLALLSLDAEVRATPFVETTTAPRPSDTLTAWGYGDSPMSMRSFSLRVGDIVDRHLRVNLPDDVIADVQKAGTPDLDVEILPIDDPIAAGLSGAPWPTAACAMASGTRAGRFRRSISPISPDRPSRRIAMWLHPATCQRLRSRARKSTAQISLMRRRRPSSADRRHCGAYASCRSCRPRSAPTIRLV
jgi:hypothetical protein